jgi:hypothetical protein
MFTSLDTFKEILQAQEKVMGSNLLRYAFTERNILSYIQHPYIVT